MIDTISEPTALSHYRVSWLASLSFCLSASLPACACGRGTIRQAGALVSRLIVKLRSGTGQPTTGQEQEQTGW